MCFASRCLLPWYFSLSWCPILRLSQDSSDRFCSRHWASCCRSFFTKGFGVVVKNQRLGGAFCCTARRVHCCVLGSVVAAVSRRGHGALQEGTANCRHNGVGRWCLPTCCVGLSAAHILLKPCTHRAPLNGSQLPRESPTCQGHAPGHRRHVHRYQ